MIIIFWLTCPIRQIAINYYFRTEFVRTDRILQGKNQWLLFFSIVNQLISKCTKVICATLYKKNPEKERKCMLMHFVILFLTQRVHWSDYTWQLSWSYFHDLKMGLLGVLTKRDIEASHSLYAERRKNIIWIFDFNLSKLAVAKFIVWVYCEAQPTFTFNFKFGRSVEILSFGNFWIMKVNKKS